MGCKNITSINYSLDARCGIASISDYFHKKKPLASIYKHTTEVCDVHNTTSRSAATQMVGSSCMGVPSDSFLYRALKPPAMIYCRPFWRNLTLVPWPKKWVIPMMAWFECAMSHLKLKKMHQYNWKFFHYVVCGTCNVDVPLALNSPPDLSPRNFLCLWGLQQLLEIHASTAMMKHGESRRSLFGAIYNWMVFWIHVLHSETPWLNLQSQCALWAHCAGLTCYPILAMQLQGKNVCVISNNIIITIGTNWI